MRIPAAVLVFCALALPVLAAEVDGKIRAVDPENQTITLDNGETYRLPPEMDISVLKPGMDLVLAYINKEDKVKQITDMVLPE